MEFMKKSNVIIIGAIVLFIGLYQYFVLAPYQKKVREWEAFQKSQQAQTVPAAPVANSETSASSSASPSTTRMAQNTQASDVNLSLELSVRNKIVDYKAGTHRSIQILDGAMLGSAILNDFFVRGVKEKTPVVLNNKGLVWTSSNADIQSCLNSLRQDSVVDSSPTSFLARANFAGATCEWSLVPDVKFPGLFSMKLILEGFRVANTDVIRLQGEGLLGSTHQMDQNYLSYKLDSSIKNIRGKDLFKETYQIGKLDWMTWGDRYFSIILKPEGIYNPNLRYKAQPVATHTTEESTPIEFVLEYPAQPEPSKNRFEFSNQFYFGTRDTTILNEIDPLLVETVDLGFFASVARVMLWSLKTLNRLFDNFGISIIALTILVRILFWPLNKKAYLSTLKMKEIQPELERIRKKFDTKDRAQVEQMNREIFALYKNKKVNPLGGCLPMLLQLPIFIGLYGALSHSIDLYQAPFFGWLQDLSLPDPYYIFPIIWTLSLLGYLAVNPQAMNTNQPGMPNMKWIMIGMNLFFGFLSKDWPAGLLVYLVVSNCVGLSQQYFLMRSNTKPQLLREGA
jgi:YidC/Oxa1 family membrane protein insertase